MYKKVIDKESGGCVMQVNSFRISGVITSTRNFGTQSDSITFSP